MLTLSSMKSACAMAMFLAVATTVLAGQNFTTLHNFKGIDGANPYTDLVQGRNGVLYGTTIDGGANAAGNVFAITPSGKFISLYSFCPQSNCADGQNPAVALVLGLNGNLYGTTQSGGSPGGYGTVFEMTPSGNVTIIHTFDGTDGAASYSPLVLATDGNFYGTTNLGGTFGLGTFFRMSPTGTLTTLYNFCSQANCSDGQYPVGGLIQARDGNIYGTTHAGGNMTCHDGCGTVFKMSLSGMFTTLHSFDQADGEYPYGGVVQGIDGRFYGTTGGGGAFTFGNVFTMTPNGTLTSLHDFDSTDGSGPYALALGSDGNFYGTTSSGGSDGYGTVFSITPSGALTTLHSFDVKDGAELFSGLVQGTNGTFYGTTYFGGHHNDGTMFGLSMNLQPFVTFVVAGGMAGQSGGILGQGFTGTSSVALNGIPMEFRVVSDTYIRATVPAKATSGYVTVTTPSGVLTSNVPFQVIP